MHNSRQSGVTLIELVVLVLWFAMGCAGAVLGSARYGWVGGTLGFLLGLAVPAGLVQFHKYMNQMLYRGRPTFPICRNGKCHYNDYRYQPVEGGGHALFCQCGDRYVKTGRRFMEQTADGSRRPYMIWKAFKGWFPDSQ